MLQTTTKTEIASQSTGAAQTMAVPGKAVAHRALPKDAPAVPLDKAVANLKLLDDHQAPAVRAPSLEGVQTPEPPRKIKGDALGASQRALLGKEFKSMASAKQAARSGQVGMVQPGKPAPFKEPSVLEFVGSDGEKQRWFISKTQRKGSYGKFRIAVKDNAPGAPAVVMAVKEYRLDDRESIERLNPSRTQRKKAILALREIAKHHAVLQPHALSLELDLKKGEAFSEKGAAQYEKMVNYIIKTVRSMGSPIPPNLTRYIHLTTKTGHIAREAIAEENALYPLANSPLRVQESVERDGRVYNFSELMRGEFFDVVNSEHLSRTDRNIIARSTARDSTARLTELHDANIIHRDIKLENVFMDNEGRAQHGDWGFAVLLQDGKATGTKGTMDYVAPEVLSGLPYGKPADIYSLGQTIAVSSLGELLLDTESGFRFSSANKVYSTEHEALGLIIERLTFDRRGAIEPMSLMGLRSYFNAHAPPYNNRVNIAIQGAIADIIPRIERWNRIDAQLCGTVLNHMLRGDPAARSDAHDLRARFTKLQPESSPVVAHAQKLAKEILSQATDVDAEIAVVQAYGKAYNAQA